MRREKKNLLTRNRPPLSQELNDRLLTSASFDSIAKDHALVPSCYFTLQAL